MAPDGYAWNTGELLYIGYDDSHRYYDAAGQWVCDVVYKFKYKEKGWNNFLTSTGVWTAVTLDGTTTGTPPYASNNFDNLFQYAFVF